MEPLERQSDSAAATGYFDPDAPDMSEQHFAASLDSEVEATAFVVDVPDDVPAEDNTAGPSLSVFLHASPGDSCRQLSGRADLDIPEQQRPHVGTDSDPASDWRDQVSAKVNNYKSRKTPKVRYPSLQLQFEPPVQRLRQVLEAEDQFPVELHVRPVTEVPVILEATARILEFPRASSAPAREPAGEEMLADPVLDRPRIVEAPALVSPLPALGGILIEEAIQQEPERRPGFDMPLQTAPLSRRFLAGAVDALLVTVGLATFGYVFLRFSGPFQTTKLLLQNTVLVVAILWSAYQYAFLVYTGSTPGLRLSRLAITHFDGTPISRSMRRWRALASLLSCASLGLGYAWCFLDQDQLSWHDRITKTHLSPLNSAGQS